MNNTDTINPTSTTTTFIHHDDECDLYRSTGEDTIATNVHVDADSIGFSDSIGDVRTPEDAADIVSGKGVVSLGRSVSLIIDPAAARKLAIYLLSVAEAVDAR